MYRFYIKIELYISLKVNFVAIGSICQYFCVIKEYILFYN